MTEITDLTLNCPPQHMQGGLMLNFGDQGNHQISSDVRWEKPSIGRSRPEAEAQLIGTYNGLKQGPQISASSITIKRQTSFDLGLPKFFGFALPAAAEMATDLLNLYGEDGFYRAQINFIAVRTDVEPERAQRDFAGFDDWHVHLDPNDVDYIYSLCGDLPTEFKTKAGEIYQPPANSLTRFGAEIEHRSPKNTTGQTLRRMWSAFVIRPEGPIHFRGQKRMSNIGLAQADNPKRNEFLQAGTQYLANYSAATPEMDVEPT